MPRRHDIDALRALAFGLLILYHVGMFYVAGWEWHVKSAYAAEWLRWPMRFVNLWRMDLIFLVSGVALSFLAGGKNAQEAGGTLFAQRSLRLLLPLAFGMAVIVPIQPYAQGVSNGLVEPGFAAFLARYYTGGPWPYGAFDGWDFGVTWNHLWYLAYLWVYTAVLLSARPVLELFKQNFLALRNAWLVLVPALPLAFYALVLQPRFPATHDLLHDWYLHAVYFTLFAYGWWIGADAGFWAEAKRLRHWALGLALIAFFLIKSLYAWCAIVAILGYAHAHLNRPLRWLAWANESVYPWYLLHQSFIVALGFLLAPYALGPWLEPAAILAGTLLGCWLVTDGLARRIGWLRPWVGLKRGGLDELVVLAYPSVGGKQEEFRADGAELPVAGVHHFPRDSMRLRRRTGSGSFHIER
jgi:glucan biosynthesis protein C